MKAAPVEHAVFWGGFDSPEALARLEQERFGQLTDAERQAVEYVRHARTQTERRTA